MTGPASYYRLGQTITRLFVAGVLLLAAWLKFAQLLTPDIAAHRLWHLLQVEGELLLATWLLSGLWRRAAFGAAVATFGAFTVYSVGKATAGAATCGCFGRAEVDPRVTLALDAVVVGLLLVWFPWGPSRPPRRGDRFVLFPLAFGVVVVTSYLAATYLPGRLRPDGRIAGDPRHVELAPGEWVDRPFPLAPYLTDAPDLRAGRWNLMFVRHDCPLCHAALDDLRAAATDPGTDVLSRIVLVEVPPYGRFPQLEAVRGAFRVARLRDDREWGLATPTVVKLRDGTVTAASRGYIQLPATAPSSR